MARAQETSANKVDGLLLGVSGKDLASKHGPAKTGEQLRSCMHSTLVSRLKETLLFFDALREQALSTTGGASIKQRKDTRLRVPNSGCAHRSEELALPNPQVLARQIRI